MFQLLLISWFQGVTDEDEEEQDSNAADEAEMMGQMAPDKLRAELKKRKRDAEQWELDIRTMCVWSILLLPKMKPCGVSLNSPGDAIS